MKGGGILIVVPKVVLWRNDKPLEKVPFGLTSEQTVGYFLDSLVHGMLIYLYCFSM